MNMSVERQRIANQPDHDTIFSPKYKVTTTLLYIFGKKIVS